LKALRRPKDAVSKGDADKFKKALEAVGAVVELK
jgi:ribosomal protein L7/L12